MSGPPTTFWGKARDVLGGLVIWPVERIADAFSGGAYDPPLRRTDDGSASCSECFREFIPDFTGRCLHCGARHDIQPWYEATEAARAAGASDEAAAEWAEYYRSHYHTPEQAEETWAIQGREPDCDEFDLLDEEQRQVKRDRWDYY